MLENFNKPKYLILGILIVTFLLRIINFSFPSFTTDEARLSYRAFTLSRFGEDELGRSLPLIFNSLTDYQLPVTSYITALGVLIFGKNDFGVRILFVLIGVSIVFLIYKISQFFSLQKKFSIFSVLVLATSPVLIFLSKIPNDSIILIFLVTLIFYLQIRNRNQLLIILMMFFSFLTSKHAWLVVPPFVVFTLWLYQKDLGKKEKIRLSVLYTVFAFIFVFPFLKIPQFGRSLLENSFPIFSDGSIQPAINRLRGQGIESGWPPLVEKIIFNKLHYLTIAFMHWLSNLSPGVYFGQFDKSGLFGFTQMGALAKALVIPFVLGVGYLLTQGKKTEKGILVYFVILTYPILFSYPNFNLTLLSLTLPFAALVISFGVLRLRKIFIFIIASIVILEVFTNIINISPEIKNTNSLRPGFVKEVTKDIYDLSENNKVVVSDNIIPEDIVPFVQWFHLTDKPLDYSEVSYPYRFRQSKLKNIEIIGSETALPRCKASNSPILFLSDRDADRRNKLDFVTTKIYKDGLSKQIAFALKGDCPLNEP